MTVREEIFQKLREIKPELISRYSVANLGVFGSVVRNDFCEDLSDIDLLVDFSKPIGIEFIDLADFIESKLKRKVDLVSKNAVRSAYLKIIQKDLVYV